MKSKIYNVVCSIFGLLFLVSGLDKWFHFFPVPEDMPESVVSMMNAFNQICWLLPLVGFAEFLGGILVIYPKTRLLGAIVLFPILIGIFLFNAYSQPSGLIISLVFWAIEIWILYENRRKIRHLID